MSTGEYIDTLLEEIEILKRERDLFENEGATILKVVIDSIESPSYVNPWGIFNYLKAVYPNRFNRKMETFNVEDE